MADNVTFQLVNQATPPDGTIVSTEDLGASGQLQLVKVVYGAHGVLTRVTAGTPLPVDGSGVIQPVSQSGVWTVTANIGTVAGLALDATLTGGSQKTKLVDSAGTNLASVSAAGAVKVDGSAVTQPVSGTVTAAQATAANLNATVVGTGTFAVQAAQSGNWTARVVGNAGAVVDGVNTAATAPANGILGLGIFNTTEPSPTTGQSVGIQLDSKGRVRQVLMDAAGNTRGANVNASNQLSVSVDNANVSTNLAQVGGNATLTGNGVTGTGSPRVTVSSDNTPFQIAGSPETNTVFNGTTALTPKRAVVTASASGATTILSLVSSKKLRVLALQLTASAAVNVKWQSHVTPTDLTGLAYLAANGGYVLPFNPVGWFETVAGEALDINLSAANAVGGSLTYVEV